jgi:hypothetical protein
MKTINKIKISICLILGTSCFELPALLQIHNWNMISGILLVLGSSLIGFSLWFLGTYLYYKLN